MGTLGGLGSVYGATQNPNAGSVISGLSGANTAANDISNLTGNGALTNPGVGSTLGAAGSGLGIYNAIENPTLGNLVGGAAGAVNLANTGSNLAGGTLGAPATGALGEAGTALGGIGAGLGLYNALQNPSNPLNDISGALDAYKLYNSGSALAGSLGAGASTVPTGTLGVSGAIDTAGSAGDAAITSDVAGSLGTDAAAPAAADAGMGAADIGVSGTLGLVGALGMGAYLLSNAPFYETPQASYAGALAGYSPTSFNPSGNAANDAASAANAANEEAALNAEGIQGYIATGGLGAPSIGGHQNPLNQVKRGGMIRRREVAYA